MKTYIFSSDSGIRTITAATPDEAANKYSPQSQTMADLVAGIEQDGGYISIDEDGIEIERVSPN